MASRILTRPAIRRGSIKEFFGGDPTLKGCWSLDGHARDESGNANHGTVTNAVPYIGKMGGLSYYFNAASKIEIANSASIQIAQTNAVTFMGWVEPRQTTNRWEEIFDKANGTQNSLRFSLAYNVGWPYQYYFLISKQGVIQINCTSSVYPVLGQRRLITCIFTGGSSGTNMFIYVDGALSGTASFNQTGCTDCVANLVIGVMYTSIQYMTGIIDNFGMFKRAVSPAEISQYYQWATATPRKYWFYSPEVAAGHIGIWGRPAGHGLIR